MLSVFLKGESAMHQIIDDFVVDTGIYFLFDLVLTTAERDLVVQALWFMANEGRADDNEIVTLVQKLGVGA
jgi:hypothetical protein